MRSNCGHYKKRCQGQQYDLGTTHAWSCLAMIHTACTIPGIKPSRVSKIFNQNAPFNPTVRKTPRGGRIIAKIIRRMLIISELVICELFTGQNTIFFFKPMRYFKDSFSVRRTNPRIVWLHFIRLWKRVEGRTYEGNDKIAVLVVP